MQALAYKVESNLSDKKYSQARSHFPAYLPSKNDMKEAEEELLEGATFDQLNDPSRQAPMGLRVSLKEILLDAIQSAKWGLKPGVNQVKISGDGGQLYRRKSMICLFLQSLMGNETQSLESSTPIAIAVGKVFSFFLIFS